VPVAGISFFNAPGDTGFASEKKDLTQRRGDAVK
jgi:hypothetical protein